MAVAGVALTNVSKAITATDRDALRAGFGVEPLVPAQGFDEEIRRISAIQRTVLAVAPVGVGLPEEAAREPLDLLQARQGLCYDRARTVEKALTVQGFRVRHVFILYADGAGLLRALFTRGQPTHAVTEVRTSRGWLLVDSNEPFLALDRLGRPHAARQLPWVPDTLLPRPPAFQLPYWAIPGLYSRKGTLFWPYIRYIPNVHWGDLWGGLLGGA
jgi:hypothetical protein